VSGITEEVQQQQQQQHFNKGEDDNVDEQEIDFDFVAVVALHPSPRIAAAALPVATAEMDANHSLLMLQALERGSYPAKGDKIAAHVDAGGSQHVESQSVKGDKLLGLQSDSAGADEVLPDNDDDMAPLALDDAYDTDDDMAVVPRSIHRMKRWVAAAASQRCGSVEAARKHFEHTVDMEAAYQEKVMADIRCPRSLARSMEQWDETLQSRLSTFPGLWDHSAACMHKIVLRGAWAALPAWGRNATISWADLAGGERF